MKKMKLMKPVLMLMALFVFTMCEENGPLQFAVVDDITTSVEVKGLEGQSYFSTSTTTEIGDLLGDAATFVDANIESVKIQLEADNYDGETINATVQLTVDGVDIINKTLELSTTAAEEIEIPSSVSNILAVISNKSFPVGVTLSTDSPISDNDFSLNLTFNIKATVE